MNKQAEVKQLTREEQFQADAKKYAACAISSIREMVEAMEHAAECDGDCEDCDGSGKQPCDTCGGTGEVVGTDESGHECLVNCPASQDLTGCCENGERDCITCKGSGKCQAGADSDQPDAWHDEDEARQRIEEDALSVDVRSDWHTPGDEDAEATEYAILITTGGPAARITGNLGAHCEPTSAVFEYQDWFQPWTEVYTGSADAEILLKYAQVFYFGEG